jgi:hypothetical protein
MKNPIPSLLLCLALTGGALAQDPVTPKGKRSDEIMIRMRQVDLLNRILPLLLTKAQLREILPAVEKARKKEREILALEDKDLATVADKLEEAVTKGIEAGVPPSKAFQMEIATFTNALYIRRQAALYEMIDEVYKAIDKQLDPGQKKVMANTLKPNLLDPKAKAEEMTDVDKIRFFIRMTLLDDAAYDVLKKLYLRPEPPAPKPDGG